jgi:hypothetical protein
MTGGANGSAQGAKNYSRTNRRPRGPLRFESAQDHNP